MIKKVIIFAFILLLSFVLTSHAQSPFSSSQDQKKSSREQPAFMQKIISSIGPLQQKLRANLSKLAKELKNSKSPGKFALIFFFSFLYGTLHALGPGHGKVIAFSYFASSSDTRFKSGIIVGTAIAFMQALSAILLVTGMYFILNESKFISIEATREVITQISFGMILLVGIYLLVDFLRTTFKNTAAENAENINKNKRGATILSVGIVPCAGTIIILLFTLSLGILPLGIIMSFFIALGMSLTISLAGITAISTKKGLFKFLHNKSKWFQIFQGTIQLSGALVIILFGAIMLIGSL